MHCVSGLLIIYLVLAQPVAAAERGIEPWFPCGILFWGECDPVLALPTGRRQVEEEQEGPSLEDLTKWGTPVVGPSGALSYQLPPKPILDLFVSPSDHTAQAYLAWQSEKAESREAAFAAIRRAAPGMGYTVGKQPLSGSSDLSSLSALTGLDAPGLTANGLPSQTQGVQTPTTQALVNSSLPSPVALTGKEDATSRKPGSLSQQTRIFYFFSPGCPYCRQQTPVLNEMFRGRADVIGIAMDTTRQELVKYVEEMHITFPVTLDAGESHTFSITGYPMLIALKPNGQAVRLSGLVGKAEVLQFLREI